IRRPCDTWAPSSTWCEARCHLPASYACDLIGPLAEPSAAARLDADAGGQALEQDVAAKAVELGRPTAGAEAVFPGRLDQAAGLDQPAEVLLVQMRPQDRLHGLLQLEQREEF